MRKKEKPLPDTIRDFLNAPLLDQEAEGIRRYYRLPADGQPITVGNALYFADELLSRQAPQLAARAASSPGHFSITRRPGKIKILSPEASSRQFSDYLQMLRKLAEAAGQEPNPDAKPYQLDGNPKSLSQTAGMFPENNPLHGILARTGKELEGIAWRHDDMFKTASQACQFLDLTLSEPAANALRDSHWISWLPPEPEHITYRHVLKALDAFWERNKKQLVEEEEKTAPPPSQLPIINGKRYLSYRENAAKESFSVLKDIKTVHDFQTLCHTLDILADCCKHSRPPESMDTPEDIMSNFAPAKTILENMQQLSGIGQSAVVPALSEMTRNLGIIRLPEGLSGPGIW